MDQIAGITATGKLGEKPKVTFKTPMTVQNNTYAVLQKGDGATIQKGDRVCAQGDRKSTRLNSSHREKSRMPSSA